MRISNNQVYNTVLSNIGRNTKKIDMLNYQLSSGSKIRYASDDPVNTIKTMGLTTNIGKIDQYLDNIQDGKDWLSATESALDQQNNIMQRVRALLIQGGNDSYTQQDKSMIADEINQLLDEFTDVANTAYGKRYLFSGAETLGEPFNELPFEKTLNADDEIINVVYKGDNAPIYREVDSGTRVQVNTFGDQVFMAESHTVTSGLNSILDAAVSLDNYIPPSQGYFKINGEKIYYDTTADSLNDIAARINSKDIGVTASVDEDTSTAPSNYRLALTSDSAKQLWINDIDRDPGTAGIQGLMNDLEITDENANPPSAMNYVDNIHADASEYKMTTFDVLIKIRDDLRANNSSELSGEDLRLLDASMSQIMSKRSEIGARINRLNVKEAKHQDYRLNNTELLQRANDTDMAQAIMDLKQYQTMQQAALSVGAQIFRLSLVDFLR